MRLRSVLEIAGWLLLVCLGLPEARAQGSDAPDSEPRWDFVAALGAPRGGAADPIEDAMRASGLDHALERVEHPFSSGAELAWAFSLRRRIGPGWDVEVVATRAGTGTTLGYGEPAPPFGGFRFLFLSHSVTTAAPIVSYRIANLHMGGGLGAHRLRVERTDSGGPDRLETWKPGLIIDAGITFPRRSRVLLEVRGQYRWIPEVEVGPYVVWSGVPEGIPSTMPAMRIDMSHAYVSAGLGVRF